MKSVENPIQPRRPRPPHSVARIPWGYLAAFLSALTMPIFWLIIPLSESSACGAEADIDCVVGLGIWSSALGLIVSIAFFSWFMRLGWIFAVTFISCFVGLLPLADSTQNLLTVALLLVIPLLASLASVYWGNPWYKSWINLCALAASAALLAWFAVWLFA